MPGTESGHTVGQVLESPKAPEVCGGDVRGEGGEIGELGEGEFFGLPAVVKSLLEEHRGISQLYGRCVCV